MPKVYERLQNALREFTECPNWREFLHDMDCTSPSGHEDHPDDRLCKCDGPHRIEQVEQALSTEFSPEFDDFEFEPILEWANAKVVKNEAPDDVDDPEVRKVLEEGFSLCWKHGFIGFDGIEDEQKARKASALFIYLWTRGVYAAFAERCATAYVLNYEIRRVQ